MPQDDARRSDVAASTASSLTHVPTEKGQTFFERPLSPGHGESALPEDKVEEERENIEDDWENDPENARNWSFGRKWTAVSIVRSRFQYHDLIPLTQWLLQLSLYTFVSPLASSMMAPGLQEVAILYHITNPTVLALTLSIYLLSYAIGVRIEEVNSRYVH